ncbi:MAG: SIMPL domain-containing protein [Chloroflexi bacterium]|nr:SIMPL domain-containing protein [Chloroflexota bacterium]
MKRIVGLTLTALALIAAIVWLTTTNPARAADPSPRLITVTGDADVKVAPDEVILVLGVETADKNLSVAKSQNDERAKKVIAAAQARGIEAKHIQTEQIRIEPRYSDSYATNLMSYVVRKTIVITLKDISKFEDLQTAALDAGANRVHGIQFQTTELRKHRDQARALAIQAAQEKATAMAKSLGQKIGKPNSIQENYSSWWSWYDRWWGGGAMSQNVVQNVGGAGASPDEGSFAPGQITVNARVTVSFELE